MAISNKAEIQSSKESLMPMVNRHLTMQDLHMKLFRLKH